MVGNDGSVNRAMRSGVRSSVAFRTNASTRHRGAVHTEAQVHRVGGRRPREVHLGFELPAHVRVVRAREPRPLTDAETALVLRGERASPFGLCFEQVTVDMPAAPRPSGLVSMPVS